MTVQGQLAQSQRPPVFAYLPQFEAPVEFGLLGNKAIQMLRTLAEAGTPVEDLHTPGTRTATARVANVESAEMAWLVENVIQLGQHKGEWLLIQGRELLVHTRDFAAVRRAIRNRQIRSPFVYYVPTDEESNVVTI